MIVPSCGECRKRGSCPDVRYPDGDIEEPEGKLDDGDDVLLQEVMS